MTLIEMFCILLIIDMYINVFYERLYGVCDTIIHCSGEVAELRIAIAILAIALPFHDYLGLAPTTYKHPTL